MLNDQIDFEFTFPEGQENILDPRIVTEVADTLSSILNKLNSIYQIEFEVSDDKNIDIYLSSVRTGSVIVSFVARIRGGLVKSAFENPIGFVAESAAAITVLMSVLSYVGIGLNFFEPSKTAETHQPVKSLEIKITENAIKDPEVRSSLERLITIAERSRASRVTIHIPDAPICDIVDLGTNHVSRIGSKSNTSNIPFGSVSGKLKLKSEDTGLSINNGFNDLALGELLLDDGREIPVLVWWGSQHPIPMASPGEQYAPEAHIKGDLQTLSSVRENNGISIKSTKPINSSLRRVSALLSVRTQIVER